jgi:hypothetical protein
MLDEKTIAVGSDDLIDWASALGAERLWALEDCRGLTRWLERQLLAVGEEQVRVPPKLTVPERRAGRERGKSDPIDALAVARAALREPGLARPRPGEPVFRDLKLLVDHRDDLVDERRRAQQRLRWHLHQLDPTFAVPAKASTGRYTWNALFAGSPVRSKSCRCGLRANSSRAAGRPTGSSSSSTTNLRSGPLSSRRRCSSYPVAARSPPRSCWPKSGRSIASRAMRNSLVTVASRHSKRAQAACSVTGWTAAATVSSTARSTGSRSHSRATTPAHVRTSNANKPRVRADAKRSAA